MVRARTLLLAGLIMAAPIGAALAVPAPPPPPQVSAQAHALVAALTHGDPVAYGELLDPDVHVFDNGKQVASNRTEWVGQFTRWTQNADVRVLRQAIDADQILTVEHVSTIGKTMRRCGGPPNGCIVDCCDWARAGAYRLSPHGKIVEIRFLTSGSDWETPEADAPRDAP
jgi:hypothetical protein